MQAALLSDRGVVKVAGDDAVRFLNGLVTVNVSTVSPSRARFTALLTPQGKITVDFIVAEAAPADGGGFFLDCPRALAVTLMRRLNFYRLRAKVIVEDLSDVLGVMALWGNRPADERPPSGLHYPDPRLAELGTRSMVSAHRAFEAASSAGASLVSEDEYEAHRIALGIPRGGFDFLYDDAFPHEADMDQLGGIDFDKGCFVGQEVVSRIEHRGIARTRVIPVAFDGAPPELGAAVSAGTINVGRMGSSANGRGLATLRLDRISEALAKNVPLIAGSVEIRPVKASWARFAWPNE